MDRLYTEDFLPTHPDLERLAQYLESDQAPAGCMNISCVDGFLTGVVVGPESIPAAEWLSTIWAEEHPEFESQLERELITRTILALHDQKATQARSQLYHPRPIYYLTPTGEPTVTDWVGGFLTAASLRRPAWQPLIEDCGARN